MIAEPELNCTQDVFTFGWLPVQFLRIFKMGQCCYELLTWCPPDLLDYNSHQLQLQEVIYIVHKLTESTARVKNEQMTSLQGVPMGSMQARLQGVWPTTSIR